MSVALSAPETQKATLLSSSHFARSDFEPVQAHKAWFLRKACEQRLWRKDAQGKITKGIPENSCKYVSISNHLLFQALLTWLRSASLWNLAAAVQQHLVTATESLMEERKSLTIHHWMMRYDAAAAFGDRKTWTKTGKIIKTMGKKRENIWKKNMKELWTENLPGALTLQSWRPQASKLSRGGAATPPGHLLLNFKPRHQLAKHFWHVWAAAPVGMPPAGAVRSNGPKCKPSTRLQARQPVGPSLCNCQKYLCFLHVH